MVGTWSGACAIDESGWPEEVQFRLDITLDTGDVLEGSGLFDISPGTDTGEDTVRWSGPIDGSHLGDRVELTIHAEADDDETYGDLDLQLEIVGELVQDTITGDCSLGGVSGAASLSR